MADGAWPEWTPEGVVFDLDGLLVDSEGAWGRAERKVVEALGHPWDEGIRTLLLGKGPFDAARALAQRLGGVRAADVDRLLFDRALAEFEAGVAALPGARELVAALEGDVPVAVATNSRRVLAELALASAGFAIAEVVCAEDVRRPKPAAEPYIVACARLGVHPGRAVALEDSPTGVASAAAAGLWVIGCPSFPEVRLTQAHAVVQSLKDVGRPDGRATA